MVNLTESFTKLYGRAPTETEIATMMQMKAEQDARKNNMIKPKVDTAALSKRSHENNIGKVGKLVIREPRTPTNAGRPETNKYRWPYRASQKAIQINKMVKDNITVERIAYYLNVSDHYVIAEIKKWDLPQEKVQ